ncbi:MAG: STAS domain-containing protein [Thermoguttaceae bacterium]|nr:STAS domain-containing protein [Thermoguttaceae bacterium]
MSDSKVHLMVRYVDDAAIADCLDVKLNEELSIQSWGDEIYALIQSCNEEKRVVVNFSNVKFMSSSALRVLITANTKAKAKGITLFLCGVDENILEVFKITKLDTIFKIRPSEVEALHSLL